MSSRKQHPAELRERAVAMVFELRAESGSARGTLARVGEPTTGPHGSPSDPDCATRTMDLYRWLLRKHIEPYLGGAPVGKLSTRKIREWRATLLADGVSISVAAKAYRLLRAILMTAVEDDKVFPRNPCRIRGAGAEEAGERPVLTVAQVFELARTVLDDPERSQAKPREEGSDLRFLYWSG